MIRRKKCWPWNHVWIENSVMTSWIEYKCYLCSDRRVCARKTR